MRLINLKKQCYYLLIVSLLGTLIGCDVDNVFKDEQGIDIPLVLVDLNFLDTKVNLRLIDIDTEDLKDEERLTVEVYANKNIINLKGNYTNRFVVEDGTLTFSVDPNEEITPGNPLLLQLKASNATIGSDERAYTLTRKNDHFIDLAVYEKDQIVALVETYETNPEGVEQAVAQVIEESNSNSGEAQVIVETEAVILVNGENLSESDAEITYENTLSQSILITEQETYQETENSYTDVLPTMNDLGIVPTTEIYYGANTLTEESETTPTTEDLTFSFGTTSSGRSLIEGDQLLVSYSYTEGGTTYDILEILLATGTLIRYSSITTDGYSYSNAIDSFSNVNQIVVPAGSLLNYAAIGRAVEGYESCDEGVQIEIVMPEGANGSTITYDLFNNGVLKATGTEPVTAGANSFQSSVFSYNSNYTNTVKIDDTPQYDIEPNEIALTGCSSTYSFSATPIVSLNKYNLSASFNCYGEQLAATPTVLGYIRLKGATEDADWQPFTFESGFISFYLLPGTEYEVKGDFDETEYSFEFTTSLDESITDTLIAEVLSKNDELQSIEFIYTEVNSNEFDISTVVTFKEGFCLFNE